MTQIPDVFYEMYRNLPRQGPGNNATTEKAWSLLPHMPQQPSMLDIGCGSGMQTLELARLSAGKVIALDNYRPFLLTLRQHAIACGRHNQIHIVQGSMFELSFVQHTFDIIWSEGALYFLGFEQGIRACDALLKPGGFLVISDATAFVPDPPSEVVDCFASQQAELQTVDTHLKEIARVGYHHIGHFPVPESAWWEHFYIPLQKQIPQLQQKYHNDPDALAVVQEQLDEMELYRTYADQYGYMFYVMQKHES